MKPQKSFSEADETRHLQLINRSVTRQSNNSFFICDLKIIDSGNALSGKTSSEIGSLTRSGGVRKHSGKIKLERSNSEDQD